MNGKAKFVKNFIFLVIFFLIAVLDLSIGMYTSHPLIDYPYVIKKNTYLTESYPIKIESFKRLSSQDKNFLTETYSNKFTEKVLNESYLGCPAYNEYLSGKDQKISKDIIYNLDYLSHNQCRVGYSLGREILMYSTRIPVAKNIISSLSYLDLEKLKKRIITKVKFIDIEKDITLFKWFASNLSNVGNVKEVIDILDLTNIRKIQIKERYFYISLLAKGSSSSFNSNPLWKKYLAGLDSRGGLIVKR
jgi:hypothetical protein